MTRNVLDSPPVLALSSCDRQQSLLCSRCVQRLKSSGLEPDASARGLQRDSSLS